MPNEKLSTDQPDPRSPLDKALDLTDRQLFDFYQRNGIIEAGDDVSYTRENVLNIARNAYWLGVSDRDRDPEGTAKVATEIRRIMGSSSKPDTPQSVK